MTVRAAIATGEAGEEHRNMRACQGVGNDTAPNRGFACQETASGRTARGKNERQNSIHVEMSNKMTDLCRNPHETATYPMMNGMRRQIRLLTLLRRAVRNGERRSDLP